MLTRYYEPTLGRFDTRDVLFGDPLNPTSLNQYVYGVGNPISNTDPTGMCPNPAVCPPPPTFNRQQRKEWNEAGRRMTETQSVVSAQSVESPAVGEPWPPRIWNRITNPNLDWHDRIATAWTFIQAHPEDGRDLIRDWTRYEKEQLGATIGDGSWNAIRHERNHGIEVLLSPFLAAARIRSENLAGGCRLRGPNGLQVCPSALPPIENVEILGFTINIIGGLTVGDYYLSSDGNEVTQRLLHHERRHSDWYAVMGAGSFMAEYAVESRTVGPCNFLEYAAGWRSGRYSFCSL
jgi:hypothetical protein